MTDTDALIASLVPRYQFGYVLPVQVGEFIHYNFYRVFPDECVLVSPPMDLRSFSPEGVETAIKGFWPVFDFLVSRRVDRITQGGIPISARLGRKRTLALIEEGRRKTDAVVAADFEEAIDALREIGARKIAVAAKWEPTLMQNVAAYMGEAGLAVAGLTGEPHTAAEVVGLTPDAGHRIALELGRRAFADTPDADALLLAGGAWQNLGAVIQLEREYGRPVVTNPTASYWAAMKQLGLVPRRRGFGQLLDSLF